MTLILNTLIYADKRTKGEKQVDMVTPIADLGADGIELRREYFDDVAVELPETAQKAKDCGLLINYSVPDVLFCEDGRFNPKIAGYYEEGKQAGINKIKFNIGNFEQFKGSLKVVLGDLTQLIETNIENDQSQQSGTIKPLITFLEAVKSNGIDIQYVYDMGNWAFVNEDATVAAQKLAPYTRYIHLKNTVNNAGKLTTPDNIELGLYDWRRLLQILPNDVQFAIEYPMADDLAVNKQMTLVKSVINKA